jgi:N6-adenosine-specific RNA methylase IME4
MLSFHGYQCFALDPPWPEEGGGGRGAQNHYATLKTKEAIRDCVLNSGVFLPFDNAHAYIWVTNNYLPWGLWLMKQLGFEYKTKITWPKLIPGTGYYFAGQTEDCLFGVKGTLAPRKRISSTTLLNTKFNNRTGGHSKKPPEIYEVIKGCSPGPRLEMFCRDPQPGWDAWGNEIKFGERALVRGEVLRSNIEGQQSVFSHIQMAA